MRIRFTADAVYETEGPGRGPRFAAGEIHEMREDLAHRWINRCLAEPVTEAPIQAEASPPAEPKPLVQPAVTEAPPAHGRRARA